MGKWRVKERLNQREVENGKKEKRKRINLKGIRKK